MGAGGTIEEGSPTRYRLSFWTLFWYCVGLATPIGFLAVTISLRRVPNLFAFTVSLGGAIGAAALLIAAMAATFTTDVGGDGIRGFDALGRRRLLPWDEIGAATRINLAGLKYVRLFPADGGWPLWIPLYLEKPAAFAEQVIASAPERNPLRVFLARNLAREQARRAARDGD